jgi:hypothetical protein
MEVNMKHATHSKPLRAVRIALVLLAVLAASTAARQAPAQGAAQAPGQSQAGQVRTTPSHGARVTPVPAGPSYGPVLHPQPLTSEPGAQPGQTPQAQEEKAGAAPPAGAAEVDPSARPVPRAKDPATTATRKEPGQGAKRAARLSPAQAVDIVPPAAPGPFQPLAAPPPAQPAAIVPGPAQINSCPGGTCIDTGGATYNTGVGNAAVNGQGRLCTRSGNTMQCF